MSVVETSSFIFANHRQSRPLIFSPSTSRSFVKNNQSDRARFQREKNATTSLSFVKNNQSGRTKFQSEKRRDNVALCDSSKATNKVIRNFSMQTTLENRRDRSWRPRQSSSGSSNRSGGGSWWMRMERQRGTSWSLPSCQREMTASCWTHVHTANLPGFAPTNVIDEKSV